MKLHPYSFVKEEEKREKSCRGSLEKLRINKETEKSGKISRLKSLSRDYVFLWAHDCGIHVSVKEKRKKNPKGEF